jgi:hypothetical protein
MPYFPAIMSHPPVLWRGQLLCHHCATALVNFKTPSRPPWGYFQAVEGRHLRTLAALTPTSGGKGWGFSHITPRNGGDVNTGAVTAGAHRHTDVRGDSSVVSADNGCLVYQRVRLLWRGIRPADVLGCKSLLC